jgi:hypothetical protein
VQFLNDRKELSLGLSLLSKEATKASFPSRVKLTLESLFTSYGRPDTDAYQMSFSGNADELGQWRGYGANGLGCSVETVSAELQAIADVAGWVIYDPVVHEKFAQGVLNGLRHVKDVKQIERAAVAAASFMKHSGFAPEQEFRVLFFPLASEVKFREGGDRLVPYFDFLAEKRAALRVDRILIGPGWQLAGLGSEELARHHVAQGIQRLLAARGLNDTTIASSEIPYDPR